MPESFDAVLLGAGQANNPLARSLAKAGWRVALIERGPIGGTCVNTGCTPTKAMVASARVAYLARRAGDYGVHPGPVEVRLDEVRRRKQDIVERFRSGSEKSVESTDGLTLIRGEGTFTGPKLVAVALNDGGAREVTAETVVIDTGARPAVPKLPGLDSVPWLDSTSVMVLNEVPKHLVILGGGIIAAEFGQMFRRFGSAVTIIQRGEQLLPREDRDIGDALAEVFRDDGIEVILNADATRVEKGPGGVRLTASTGGTERVIEGSHLLVATGRTPNSDAIGLAVAGITTNEKGFITVTESFETNVKGVYAVGDVTGGAMFTHVSHNDNQILRENFLNKAGRTKAGRLIPYTVFTDPQLGRVGLSESEAREKGHAVRVAKMPMKSIARAVEAGETRGLVKAVVDADTDLILGCAVLGVEGGEIMAMLQIAVMGKLPYQRLRDDMFAHPTFAEGLNNLFTRFEGE